MHIATLMYKHYVMLMHMFMCVSNMSETTPVCISKYETQALHLMQYATASAKS